MEVNRKFMNVSGNAHGSSRLGATVELNTAPALRPHQDFESALDIQAAVLVSNVKACVSAPDMQICICIGLLACTAVWFFFALEPVFA